MPTVYRSMKEGTTGTPAVGDNSRSLGVRPGIDIPASNPSDTVEPAQGGMSVSPDTPLNLPPFRRPPEWQGTGRDPVWAIDTDDRGPDLSYRPDPDNEGHAFVEPSRPMTQQEFADALAKTRERWQKTDAEEAI